MRKKAIIEMQFNWIFVVIAGALILLFFFSVVTKQKKVSDARISSTVLVDLQSILTGASVSTNTVNVVTIPQKQIEFECNKLSIDQASVDIKNKIIFAPDLIKGRKLITWALDWNVPFWITNFLYLTTPEVRYIIVDDAGSFAEKIYDDWLPDEINKELVVLTPETSIEDKNNYRVKFIFVDQPVDEPMLIGLSRMSDEHVTAIKIEKDETTERKGNITFYEKNNDEWEFKGSRPYLEKESLIAAIFSTNVEDYTCSMEKAFSKLNILTTIYKERSNELIEGLDACSNTHQEASNELDSILDSLDSDPVDINSIYAATNSLENYNGIAQLKSCVLIY